MVADFAATYNRRAVVRTPPAQSSARRAIPSHPPPQFPRTRTCRCRWRRCERSRPACPSGDGEVPWTRKPKKTFAIRIRRQRRIDENGRVKARRTRLIVGQRRVKHLANRCARCGGIRIRYIKDSAARAGVVEAGAAGAVLRATADTSAWSWKSARRNRSKARTVKRPSPVNALNWNAPPAICVGAITVFAAVITGEA